MNSCLENNIFSKLPLEIVDKIMSLYYGPPNIDIYIKKKELNESIKNSQIYLHIANNDLEYKSTPELFEYNGDIWYDYHNINVCRLPRLLKEPFVD